MTANEAFEKFGRENFLPCMCSFNSFILPEGGVVAAIAMCWKAPPKTKLQILHTTDGANWEERPNLIVVPPFGTIQDTAPAATGPYDMAFIIKETR